MGSVTSYPCIADTPQTNVLETRSVAQSIPRTWLPTQARRKSLHNARSPTRTAVAVAFACRLAEVLSAYASLNDLDNFDDILWLGDVENTFRVR